MEMIELIKTATAATTTSERQATMPRSIQASAAVATRNTEADDKSSKDRQADVERMRDAIEHLAQAALADSRLTIEKHDDAGVFVYSLVDSDTGSVMRQWPQKELVELREYLRTRQAGLIDQRA